MGDSSHCMVTPHLKIKTFINGHDFSFSDATYRYSELRHQEEQNAATAAEEDSDSDEVCIND